MGRWNEVPIRTKHYACTNNIPAAERPCRYWCGGAVPDPLGQCGLLHRNGTIARPRSCKSPSPQNPRTGPTNPPKTLLTYLIISLATSKHLIYKILYLLVNLYCLHPHEVYNLHLNIHFYPLCQIHFSSHFLLDHYLLHFQHYIYFLHQSHFHDYLQILCSQYSLYQGN